MQKTCYLCTRFRDNQSTGEMVEWSITVVLKTTVLRGTGGSNPSLSANNAENQRVRKLPPKLPPKMVILGVNFAPHFIHNARFDEGCLKAVFKVYQMDYPDYRFYDTLTASRRQFGQSLPNHQLHTVAAACGYDLQNHHHALADAEACAAIALYLL